MLWSEEVIYQFQTVPPNVDAKEHDFHGPYNKLLNFLFPLETKFTIVPQYHKSNFLLLSDYIVCFQIDLNNRPVFILELKRPSNLGSIPAREMADMHIRKQLSDLEGQLPIFW